MKKTITLVFLIASTFCFAQKPVTFDSIAVITTKDTIKLKCKTTIIYSERGLSIISEDKRLYSFILPGIEFADPQVICFNDTKQILDDPLAEAEGPIIIYQSIYSDMQVAQYIREESITLVKKDKSGISFF